MEQHPIPRDITGFQFKLVGSMTLKQFGYVAGGAIIGYIFFKAPLGIFRLPLTGLFWFLGFALAFIPIQERPLDRWLAAFIKSVYSPTQFVWKKTPPEIEILARPLIRQKRKSLPLPQYEESRKKLEKYLKTLPLPLEQKLDEKEEEVLSRTLSLFRQPIREKETPPSPPKPGPPKKPPPRGEPISPPPKKVKPIIPPPLRVKRAEKEKEKKEVLKEDRLSQEKQLKEKIETLKKELELKTLSRDRFLELSRELTQALEEKRRLEKELGVLKKEVEKKKEEAVEPRIEVWEEEPKVKIITPKLAPKMGIPQVPQAPNIISGIVKDSLGRLLPGIIVTVKDKEGMAVRALRTNSLGLFVSATSLPSGTYTLEIEDPKKRFEFDIIKVILKGEIYSPLEILAKGEKEELRESLTKELFGQSLNF